MRTSSFPVRLTTTLFVNGKCSASKCKRDLVKLLRSLRSFFEVTNAAVGLVHPEIPK